MRPSVLLLCLTLLTGCVEDEEAGEATLTGTGVAAFPLWVIAIILITAFAIIVYRRRGR